MAGEWLGSPTKCGRLRDEDKGGGWYDQSKHVDVWMEDLNRRRKIARILDVRTFSQVSKDLLKFTYSTYSTPG